MHHNPTQSENVDYTKSLHRKRSVVGSEWIVRG